NGKTTVKEMTSAILGVNSNVLFTQGNLNNDIGVPLTLLKINEQHEFAVIEIGANHSKEIKYSSHYVKPDIAVITNVGSAHIEGFGSLERTALAKGEIIESLTGDGIVILNIDDPFFPLWMEIAKDRKVVTFGLDIKAEVNAQAIFSEIKNNKFYTHFTLLTEKGEINIKLKLAGKHNVINALPAVASCLQLGIELEQIKQGLENLEPVAGRLQPLVDEQDNLFIDDTYNANPSSLKAPLNVLMQCNGDHWVILGALAEMGACSKQIHKELGAQIKSMGVVRLFTVGADAKYTVEGFGEGAEFFTSQERLIKALKKELKSNTTLLVKGSRTQKMENVVAAFINDFRT
ncbi:MAG: UDP-N-acetylmuramoyl-tripeptide--D-alanyl-D-alanine ligase, partial [Gammaproteobacteria bacterium]|nr:UDP-N-acetylmuramoyl-tripeptide--D-alanyl-D-alanine ligase [Gammaproteobacteria bacterium]